MSQSVKMTLIPANDLYLDKKDFTWSLKNFDENGIAFDVDFVYPRYISYGGIDTLKIELYKTQYYQEPLSAELQSIPDGFTMIMKIPPKADSLISEAEFESNKQNA